MENQPQNPEFRINPENFHPCRYTLISLQQNLFFFSCSSPMSMKFAVFLNKCIKMQTNEAIFLLRTASVI